MIQGGRRVIESRFFVPLFILAATALSLVWVLSFSPELEGDEYWYYQQGENIASGRGYIAGSGKPTAVWPVGYPAFLGALFALFGPSLAVARLANVALLVVVLLLYYQISLRLLDCPFSARIATMLLATSPDYIGYTSRVMSEMLSTCSMLGAIALLLLGQGTGVLRLFGSGLVWGLSCLVRPQVILLPAIVLWAGRARENGARGLRAHISRTLLVYAVIALALLPWTVRNYRAFGALVFVSTNSGHNLLVGNNPLANGFWQEPPEVFAGIGHWGGPAEYEADQAKAHRAIRFLREHPLDALALLPKKLWALYVPDVVGPTLTDASGPKALALRLFRWMSAGHYLLASGLFGAGVFSLVRSGFVVQGRRVSTLGLWIIGVFTLITLVLFGQRRYRFPILPWMFMYAAVGIGSLKKLGLNLTVVGR